VQPTERAFDDPPSLAQTTAMRPTFASQSVRDAHRSQPPMMGDTPISPISLHQVGAPARPSCFTANCRDSLEQGLELATVMHVSSRHLDAERNALGIGAKMMLAARFAAVGRVWPRLKPPKTARTLLESTTALDQSRRSARFNRRSNSRWSFSQTPAFCQSRSRRQHVMPLPQPNSSGKSCQAMPLLSTKRIPVRAARSEIGLRPGHFLRRDFLGSKGWMILQSESSISGFAILSFLQRWSKKYNSFCYTLLVLSFEF
jgi:hypothetical protein